MSNINELNVPPKLALTALLSGGITIVSSICYISLCVVALIYRNRDLIEDESNTHAQGFWRLLYHVYFQNEASEQSLAVSNVTTPYRVFVLVAITLALSILTLITSIVLIVGVKRQELFKHISAIATVYIVSWVCSLTADVTLATNFGMDYTYLTDRLNAAPEYVIAIDQLRIGAMILMTMSLKGYITLALNAVLICLIIVYLYKHNDASNKEQHSIHKVGPLNAFDERRPEESWSQQEYASPYNRGRPNNAFINDDDQPRRLPPTDFYPTSSQPFSRSESWQHQPSAHGSRPFSYMDEGRLAAKAPSAPTSPASQEPWRRDPWNQGPPVPAPDYSPHGPRRLKSALKPAGYM